MKTLYIDTSSSFLYAGILEDTNILQEVKKEFGQDLSKEALPEIDKLFKKAKLNPKDINKIVVVNGPGSFTGIRIGITIAKTYAWALNLDIITVNALEAMSISCEEKINHVPILDARRGYVFAAIYDKDSNIIKYNSSTDLGNLQFNKYDIFKNNNATISLSCPNNDKFSVSNIVGNGALTYPVGLLSIEEAELSKGLLTNNGDTILMSPSYFLKNKAYGMKELGNTISVTSIGYGSIRPVISIKDDVEFLYGYGTYDHPYVLSE